MCISLVLVKDQHNSNQDKPTNNPPTHIYWITITITYELYSVKNTILYIVTDTLQTSHKVKDIDILFYLHNLFNTVFYIYHDYIILYLCKCDPILMIQNNIILAHVFYLLNDLAQWSMQRA